MVFPDKTSLEEISGQRRSKEAIPKNSVAIRKVQAIPPTYDMSANTGQEAVTTEDKHVRADRAVSFTLLRNSCSVHSHAAQHPNRRPASPSTFPGAGNKQHPKTFRLRKNDFSARTRDVTMRRAH